MKSRPPIVIGYSTEDRAIEVWLSDMDGPGGTLIIGGFHGNEPATVEIVREFDPPPDSRVALLPLLNPDGALRYSRYNANGVDLNRNFSTNWRKESAEPSGAGPWSETESRALRDFIRTWEPAKIVSVHWALGEIDADGEQSTPLAEAMWASLSEEERVSYRLRVTELGRGLRRLEQTYLECPGSLGQWAGYGVEYQDGSRPAMITLELPHDPAAPRTDPLPEDHLEAVQKRWKADATGYLREARGPAEKMLLAATNFGG